MFGSSSLFGSSVGEHAAGSGNARGLNTYSNSTYSISTCGISTCSGNTYSVSSDDDERAVVRSEAVGFTCTDGFGGSGFHAQLDTPWVGLVSSSPSSNIRSECGFSGDPGSQQRLAVGIFAT